ncbi:MAG: FAD-dependent oxidoreductase, partial [Planctomycetes bacterium]|nr:FAD-dependent oxidoreductase [Planctomycetota bacterium]
KSQYWLMPFDHKTGGLYYIPFRSLYSRNLGNLMMAGRCFSCSHIGLCGPRVMKTCGQMGIATGYAAALCKKHDATPRAVGQQHIDELRKLIGYT